MVGVHLRATSATNHGFPNGTYPVIDELAAGGTSEITLKVQGTAPTWYVDYEQPYHVVSVDPTALSVLGIEGAVVTVLAGSGRGTLVIDDGGVGMRLGEDSYFIAPIAAVHAAPIAEVITTADYHGGYASHVVYPAGTPELAIALVDDARLPHRLVDTSMLVTGATRTGWDTVKLPDAAPGHHTLTVRTGDGRATELDIEVVTGPDQMVVLTDNPSYVCFAALAQDAFVAGLTWTYALDGASVKPEGIGPNCVSKLHLGRGTLTATAGQVSRAVTVR